MVPIHPLLVEWRSNYSIELICHFKTSGQSCSRSNLEWIENTVVSLNNSCSLYPYQYGYKAVQIVSVMRLKPVTTSLRVMFASRYTIKVVARSWRFLCIDSFSASVQLVTQCTLLYTVSLVFSHESIVFSFILICTSLVLC